MKNQCPHPKCAKMKPTNRYACTQHWKILPKDIQKHVWSEYLDVVKLWSKADKEAKAFWQKQIEDELEADAAAEDADREMGLIT